MVLMHTCEVEPLVLVQAGLEELHIAVAKRAEEALVANIAHAVQGKLGGSFLQEYRLDLDVVGFWRSAVVVQEARHLQDVESSKMAFAGWVVVITVDGEDRDGDVDIGIFVVDVVE
jgi:hypothetical protein